MTDNETSVAGFVCDVIFSVSINVIRLVRVPGKGWDGSDELSAGVERKESGVFHG